MKDAIGNKIIEVVENILAKDAKDITYNEYCIIKNVYDQIKYEEEQDEKNKKFLESILNTLYCGFGTPPTPIQFKQNISAMKMRWKTVYTIRF